MPDNTGKKNPNQDDRQRQPQQGGMGGQKPKQGDIGKQGDLGKERKGVDRDLDDDLDKPIDE